MMALAYGGPVSPEEVEAAQHRALVARLVEEVGSPLGPFLASDLEMRCTDPGGGVYRCGGRPLLGAFARPWRFRLCPGQLQRPEPEKQVEWVKRWFLGRAA